MLNKTIRFLKIFILIQTLLIPEALIAYLWYFGFGAMQYESEVIHGIVVLISAGISFFVAYIAFLNYQKTGEAFLRYMSLGFFSFFVLYFPQLFLGVFGNMPLFVGYGAASRFALALYMLYGVLAYWKEPDTQERRQKGWLWHIITLVCVSLFGLPLIILGLHASSVDIKVSDYITIIIFLGTFIAMRIHSAHRFLNWLYISAACFFISACSAFILGDVWSHYWWFAHGILVAAFYIVLYILIKRYEITAAFTRISSEMELYRELADRAQKLEEVNKGFSRVAQELETSLTKERKTTHELIQKNKELERITKILSERELRMIELKKQVADLEARSTHKK
jgi:hypothetical protein